MKKYKVLLGGRGADVYLHQLDENQKNELVNLGIEDESKIINYDKLNEILKVSDWSDSEEVFTGLYPSSSAYIISVYDENKKLVWESDNEFYMEIGEDDEDYNILDKENYLLIENYVKGTIKEYILEIEEEFDSNKFTFQSIDINEKIELIIGLKYDNKELELEEWGDYWSNGTYFHIL